MIYIHHPTTTTPWRLQSITAANCCFPDSVSIPAMEQMDPQWKRGRYTVKPSMIMTLSMAVDCVPQQADWPAKSRPNVSSLFPKSTVQRDDFEEICKNYERRNDIVVGEDQHFASSGSGSQLDQSQSVRCV
jgi:hypothetical protein